MTGCLSTASEDGRAFRCESNIEILFILPVLVIISSELIPLPYTVSW